MRLNKKEINSIKKTFLDVFQDGKIYLFGSRVNDTVKGGDIDLYIQSNDKKNLLEKKIDFLVKLKQEIGDQKIDLIISKDTKRLIEVEALKTGVEL